jgi:prolyl-tRNA editing enzyme YbaK/EbsC (Cys-tRNA(Pro) deacylase)
MSALPPVSQKLTELGIPHRVFRHAGQVTSLEQAAAERGQRVGQVVRSIVFRLGEGRFAMVLVAGPAQISWPALRAHFGQSRLTMANETEVLAATGYRPGTVSPIGLPQPLPILVDQSPLKEDELSLGSGERNVAVILRREDLFKAIGKVETGTFVADGQSALS